jgi:hypothetical protein
MRRQKMGKTALAQRMNVHLPQVDRLLDVHHGSTIEQLDAAAKALGGHVRIELVMPEHMRGAMISRVAGMDAGRKARTARAPKRHRSGPRVHAGVLATAKRRRDSRRVIAGKKR